MTAPDFSAARAAIERSLRESGVASCAVAVARDGEVLWEEGFGWADRERRLAASAHVPYSLASISKPVTATALMTLVAQGRIDLDRPVSDYLGAAALTGRASAADGATVRRVANHTSGLGLHYHFFYDDEPYSRPPMETTIARYGVLVSRPDERWQYSNLGYGILEHAIEVQSGRSYPDAMRRRVFEPLGMHNSAIGIPPGCEDRVAARYGGDGLPYPFYDFDHRGGSAVYASAHDLLRFGMFHVGTPLPDQRQVLDDGLRLSMQEPTATVDGMAGYGVGWRTDEAGHGPVRSHGGGMAGVSTVLTLLPEQRIVIVILTNKVGNVIPDTQPEILAALLPGYTPPSHEEEDPTTGEPARPDTSALAGVWEGEAATHEGAVPVALRAKPDGDVHVRVGRGLWSLLNEFSADGDFVTGRALGTFPTADADKRGNAITLELWQRHDRLEGALISVSTREREGAAPPLRVPNALTHWVSLARS